MSNMGRLALALCLVSFVGKGLSFVGISTLVYLVVSAAVRTRKQFDDHKIKIDSSSIDRQNVSKALQ